MRDFAEFVTTMYNNRYNALMSRIQAGKIPCGFFCLNVTPVALAMAASLRAQNFNISHIVSVFPPSIPNSSGLEIIAVNAFASIKPAPEYLFIGGGMDGTDFVFASQMIDIDRHRIISLAPPAQMQFIATAYDAYMQHLPEIYDFYSSLIDEESRKVFCDFMMARVSDCFGDAIFADTPQYICEGFTPEVGDILIDGGACDGYTAAMFAERGCKVYSFEMDRKNFEIASALAKEKNFIVENFGLGSSNRTENYVHVEGNMGASHIGADGNETAQIIALDSYVDEHQLPSVDFIKLDVEGAEFDVLKGAAQSIKKYKPKLAICAYHKHEDLWTLMPFIKSLRSDYEFAFRHYAYTHEEEPFIIDENKQRLFDFFGLDGRLPSTQESVLFCR